MSYCQNQGLDVIAGGLCTPWKVSLMKYSDNVFGKGDTIFIVDGIDLSLIEEGEEEKKKIVLNIIDSENSFFDNI